MAKLHYLPNDPLNPKMMLCGFWLDHGVEYTTNRTVMKILQEHGSQHACSNCLKLLRKKEADNE
jgi:hypothetical protein